MLEVNKRVASVLTDSNEDHSEYVSVTLPSSKKNGTKYY